MKYITIDSLGKRRFVFDEEAAQKAMDEGKIVVDDKFNILNPIILTPECDGKFAVIKENEPAKFIKYHAGCELGYEIDGNLYNPFGHANDTADYWTEERTWEETEKLLQATIHYGE
jgi:hypothetical protein